jgi:hypothetical protein
LITDAYGDFASVVIFDMLTRTVTHVTAPEEYLHSFYPIPWNALSLQVTIDSVFFKANVAGWNKLYVMPLTGFHKHQVIEIRLDWEGGGIVYHSNARNGRPYELVLRLLSFRSKGSIGKIQIEEAMKNVQKDNDGHMFISPAMIRYQNATAKQPVFRTIPPELIKYKSFDGLEIPAMYFHPKDKTIPAPVVISIHGGPESQSTASSQMLVPRLLPLVRY